MMAMAPTKLERVLRMLSGMVSWIWKINPTIRPKNRSQTILGICVLLKIKFPINPRIIIAPRMIKTWMISIIDG